MEAKVVWNVTVNTVQGHLGHVNHTFCCVGGSHSQGMVVLFRVLSHEYWDWI